MRTTRPLTTVVSMGAALMSLAHSGLAQTNASLRIENLALEDENIARLTVSGPAGSAFVIESSFDCDKWSLLSFTNTTPLPQVSTNIPPFPPQMQPVGPGICLLPAGRAEGIGSPRKGPVLFYRLRATNVPAPLVLTNLFQPAP